MALAKRFVTWASRLRQCCISTRLARPFCVRFWCGAADRRRLRAPRVSDCRTRDAKRRGLQVTPGVWEHFTSCSRWSVKYARASARTHEYEDQNVLRAHNCLSVGFIPDTFAFGLKSGAFTSACWCRARPAAQECKTDNLREKLRS